MSNLTNLRKKTKYVETLTFQLDGANYYLTDELELRGRTVAWIGFPAAWTAAVLTALVNSSDDGDADTLLYDKAANGIWQLTTSVTGTSRVVRIPLSDFVGFQAVKFQSGTSAAQVDQTAARVLTVGCV